MPADNRVVLSSDHAAIPLRQAIAKHVAAQGWVVVDMKSDWNQVFDPALCQNSP